MFPFQYEGDLFRPPSEAKSLIIQATIGCSHNRCTFCAMYKKKKYRERPLKELIKEIELAATAFPESRRVFLADGNALAMKTEALLTIFGELNERFAALERVALYANPHDLLTKSKGELLALQQHKLKMIYLGIESGSASVLAAVKKGVTPAELLRGALRAREAGILLSVTVINGLAGQEGSAEHAAATAALLNRIDPEYLGLLSLITVKGTTMDRQFRAGLLTALTPWEMLTEIKAMVEPLALTDTVFRANHASNYLPLRARLSEEKDQLLALLAKIIDEQSPDSLKSEYLRGL